MKKFLMTALVFATMIFAGCGGNQQSKVIIGIAESPISYRNEQGKFVGFEVSLAEETAKRMGVKAEFKLIDWDKKEAELDSGKIDMIWNALDITPERQEIMLFSDPYMDNRQVIFVLKGNPQNVKSENDFAEKTIGAKAGTTAENYINKNEKLKSSLAGFKTCKTDEETFKALEDGEIDALVCDEIIGRFLMNKQRGKFEVVGTTVGSAGKMGIGFRKNDVELRDRVQKAFDEIVKDGTAKKISEEWFGDDLIGQN